MRRSVPWIASIAFLLGIATLAITRTFSPDHSELYRAAATDFAVSLIDLAITVGVVDLLLKSYSEHQRIQSITPRAEEFVRLLGECRTVRNRYLGDHSSVGDLERYRRVAVSVQHSAFDLHMLVSASNAVLASNLLQLSHNMREHAEAIEDAISSTRNASADASRWIERVSQSSDQILESGNQLKDTLVHEYPSEKASA